MNANKLRTRLESYLAAIANKDSRIRDAIQEAAVDQTDSEFEQKLAALEPDEVAALMDYRGAWDASTNTPTLADGTGDVGDMYRVSVGGTRDLGAGSRAYAVGDEVIYNGSSWEHYVSGGPGITAIPVASRYVSKDGSDSAGDGSLARPFLTIEAAQNSITATSRFTIFIGPGSFVESATFAFRPNTRYVGSGFKGNANRTQISRSDSSTITATLSAASISNNSLHLENLEILGPGGFTVTRPAGDPAILTRPSVFLINCNFNGTKTITGSGTGAMTSAKGIAVTIDGVDTSSSPALILNGCAGFIVRSDLHSVTITGQSTDGVLTSAGPSSIILSNIQFLNFDNTLAGSSTTSLVGARLRTLGVSGFASVGPGISGSQISSSQLTGNIVSGQSKITGLSSVPTNSSGTGFTSNGIPVFGPGIPAGTLLGSSPAAGEVNLVDSSGTPVLATASATGALFWFTTGMKLTSGAAVSMIANGADNIYGYLPGMDSRWVGATPPRIIGDALDMLAEHRVLRSGDTMSGALVLAGDPSAALEASPKQYVDGKVQDAINDAETSKAPSQNAVYDALALKADASSVPADTDDLPEGSTNLYYTDGRVDARVAAKILYFDSAASAGGAASEILAVTGLLATDTILSVSQKIPGANNTPLIGWSAQGNNTLTAAWTLDPGAGAVIRVAVLR